MPTAPTTEWRVELLSMALVAGLVGSALCMVVMIVLWRQRRRLGNLLGIMAITLGVSVSAAVRLVGLTRGIDTSYLALGIELGATAIALVLVTIWLVRQRRRTSVR